MDDCPKGQTSTVTPAEPGGFPWGLISTLLALTLLVVMAGLVPAIHVFDLFAFLRRGCSAQGRA
jgi:hypothetical protein